MNFPLDALASIVLARAATWDRLGLVWRIRPVSPNHGKAIIVSEFDSATGLEQQPNRQWR